MNLTDPIVSGTQSPSGLLRRPWRICVAFVLAAVLSYGCWAVWEEIAAQRAAEAELALLKPREKRGEVVLAPQVSPGERPGAIRDARFFSIDDFIVAYENGNLNVGEWVAIEGRVKKSDVRMGASYITLRHSSPRIFSFEGAGLAKYRIDYDINVIVHCKVTEFSFLSDATLVTQAELDDAFADEAN